MCSTRFWVCLPNLAKHLYANVELHAGLKDHNLRQLQVQPELGLGTSGYQRVPTGTKIQSKNGLSDFFNSVFSSQCKMDWFDPSELVPPGLFARACIATRCHPRETKTLHALPQTRQHLRLHNISQLIRSGKTPQHNNSKLHLRNGCKGNLGVSPQRFSSKPGAFDCSQSNIDVIAYLAGEQ